MIGRLTRQSIVILIIIFLSGLDTAPNLLSQTHIQGYPLPGFVLPWESDLNGHVRWTGGPHAYAVGPQGTAQAGTGSGLDFSYAPGLDENGNRESPSFRVLNMAAGTVVEADPTCPYWPSDSSSIGFGCLVAIRHFTGESVLIYAHLQRGSFDHLIPGKRLNRGDYIGFAGASGNQTAVHLHIDLRDGGDTCYYHCFPKKDDSKWGNPIGWDDSLPLVDGYKISPYYVDSEGLRFYNYDGAATRGNVKVIHNFTYIDSGIRRKNVTVRVHSEFVCWPEDMRTCEDEQFSSDGETLFARDGGLGSEFPHPNKNEVNRSKTVSNQFGSGSGEAALFSTNKLNPESLPTDISPDPFPTSRPSEPAPQPSTHRVSFLDLDDSKDQVAALGLGGPQSVNFSYRGFDLPAGWSIVTIHDSGESRCWSSSQPKIQDHGTWNIATREVFIYSDNVCETNFASQVDICAVEGLQDCRPLEVGYYERLRNIGWNDRIVSVNVPESWGSIRIWEHDNYRGSSDCYSGKRDPLPLDDNYRIRGRGSSVVVYQEEHCPWDQTPVIMLFSRSDQRGPEIGISNRHGLIDLRELGKSDWADSATIPQGMSAKFCDHISDGCTTCRGPGEYDKFEGQLENNMSSLWVYPNETCTIPEPLAPINFRVTSESQSEVLLAWDNQNDYYHEATSLYRWKSSGGWQTVQSLSKDTTSATVSELFCNSSYRFYVGATNSSGISGSNIVIAKTEECPTPEAPSLLVPSPGSSVDVTDMHINHVRLEWSRPQFTENFIIEVWQDGSIVDKVLYEPVQSLTVYDARPGEYRLRLKSLNSSNRPSEWRDQSFYVVESTPEPTQSICPTPIGTPALPGDFDGNGTVEEADYENFMKHWYLRDECPGKEVFDFNSDGTINIIDYSIWGRLVGNSSNQTITPTPTITLEPTAINTPEAPTSMPNLTPSQVQSLVAESVSQSGFIVKWDIVDSADYYNVYYHRDNEAYQLHSSRVEAFLFFTELECGTNYWVQVRAANPAGMGPMSNELSVTTLACDAANQELTPTPTPTNTPVPTATPDPNIQPPKKVQSLRAAYYDDDEFILEWDDLSEEEYYEVYFQKGDEPMTLLFSTKAHQDAVSIREDAAECNTRYRFKVRGVNAGGNGEFSDELDIITLACSEELPPLQPRTVSLTTAAKNQLTIAWKHSGHNMSYEVWIREDVPGTLIDWVETVNDIETFTVIGLQCGTSYEVRLRNIFQDEYSEFSEPLIVNTSECSGYDVYLPFMQQ
ncbi:MAG: peptidoglycan DD-metalloendopeptidase family protein [Chloroflexota bacterium]